MQDGDKTQAAYVLGHAQDITERVQREEALKQVRAELERRVAERTAELQRALERFVKAFQASPDAIIITSMDGRYIDVNPSFQRLSGYSRDEVIRRTLHGMGWRIMHHRARMIGATLEVQRAAHGGTCIICTLDNPAVVSVDQALSGTHALSPLPAREGVRATRTGLGHEHKRRENNEPSRLQRRAPSTGGIRHHPPGADLL